jgi:hypothetical protein
VSVDAITADGKASACSCIFVLDRGKSNLALARHILKRIESELVV